MTLNQAGLILNITGTLLLILYGLPSKIIDERGPTLIAEHLDDNLTEIKKHNRRIVIRSTIGTALTCMGFICQLIYEFLL